MRKNVSAASCLAFVAGTAVALTSAVMAVPPILLRDINTTPPSLTASSQLDAIVSIGLVGYTNPTLGENMYRRLPNGKVLFWSQTTDFGFEPWVTDGTPSGTLQLADIDPGPEGSAIYFGRGLSPTVIMPYNDFCVNNTLGKAIFIAFPPAGQAWYVTDGTPAGTQMLTMTQLGTSPRFNAFGTNLGDLVIPAVAMGNKFYFASRLSASNLQAIWVSDGTPAGTQELVQLDPVAGCEFRYPTVVQTTLGDRLVFASNDGVNGRQLFMYNPSQPVNYSVTTNTSPTSNPRRITNINQSLAPGSDGVAFWYQPVVLQRAFDGVNTRTRIYFGSVFVGDPPGPSGTNAGVQDHLYYYEFETDTLVQATNVPSLDGTPAGIPPMRVQWDPVVAGPFGNERIYFLGNTNMTNGTTILTAGTRLFAHNPYAPAPNFQQVPGSPTAAAFPRRGVAVPTGVGSNTRLVFVGGSAANGWEIWTSDGTPAGTVRVTDLAPGSASGVATYVPNSSSLAAATLNYFPSKLSVVGSQFYFVGNDRGSALAGAAYAAGQPNAAMDPATTSYQLYVGNVSGSSVTVGPAIVINGPASAGLNANNFGMTRDGLTPVVMGARTAANGSEPWASSGTAATTALITDIQGTPGGGSTPVLFTDIGSKVVFNAFRPAESRELWATDGTTPGTDLVRDINTTLTATPPNTNSSNPGHIVRIGSQAVFGATNTAPSGGTTGQGYEVWKSDGTFAGTSIVADLRTGPPNGFPVVTADNLLFSVATLFTEVNGKYFAIGDNGTSGIQPTVYNPATNTATIIQMSPIGTQAVGGNTGGATPTFQPPFAFLRVGDKVYFAGADGVAARTGTNLLTAGEGGELFVYDSIANTVSLVSDYTSGPDGSRIRNLTAFSNPGNGIANGSVFMFADDLNTGLEPVIYEAGSNTMYNISDIRPGLADSWVANIPPVVLGGKVYFTATDGTGAELWSWDGSGSPVVIPSVVNPPAPTGGDPGGSFPGPYVVYNGKLVYDAREVGFGFELHEYDPALPINPGTNPKRIVDLAPGVADGVVISNFTVFNGKVYFTGFRPDVGAELFSYDGTNVVLEADINPGSASSTPDNLYATPNALYFSAFTFALGREPYAIVLPSGPTPCNPADIAATDASPGADACVDNGDFSLFISSFFGADCTATCGILPVTPCNPADIAATDAAPGADGCVDNGDFSLFISSFFTAVCPNCNN
jgi:ELWxxDGT repeat protein